MVFGNAQIDLGIKSGSGFGGNLAVLIDKDKLLLVHGSGGQQGALHPGAEPQGSRLGSATDGLDALRFVSNALIGAMAQRDHHNQFFIWLYFKCAGNLLVGHGNPAGVESELLRFQNKPFPIIATAFFQLTSLWPHESQITGDAAEHSIVGHHAVERPGLVEDQLDVKPTFAVTGLDLAAQNFQRFRRDGVISILTDTVPRFHGFHQFHILILRLYCLMMRVLHPHAVTSVRFEGKPLERKTVSGVHIYMNLYLLICVLSMLIVAFDQFDLITTFTAVASCLNNIGPGLEIVGPMGNFADFSVPAKLLLTFDMLVGRLEIFPMLVLLAPTTWLKRRRIRV